jgi:hypothetical protein
MQRIHAHRQAVRLCGLALLIAGLAVLVAFDAVAGGALIAASVLLLALVQPQILARARSRAARKVASSNGHPPGTTSEDLDAEL